METAESAPWLAINLSTLSGEFRAPDIHVCPTCIRALADFLPGVPREVIAAFAQHDRTIEISVAPASSGARIVGTVTIEEVMVTTFRPQRIEIENASQWVIEEYSIVSGDDISGNGSRSPIAPFNRADVREYPGAEFVAMMNASGPQVIAGVGTALLFRVRYVGGNPEGGVWKAKLFGRAAGFAEEGAAA